MGEHSDRSSIVARRVVVGPSEGGKGGVVSDVRLDPAGERGVELTELWRLEGALHTVLDGGDPNRDPWEMVPLPGGLAWRLVRWTKSSPTMHQTDTLDLLTVLDGRIELEYETGRVRLGVGDSVVIQDALHAWHLIDDQPCTAIAVMARPSPT